VAAAGPSSAQSNLDSRIAARHAPAAPAAILKAPVIERVLTHVGLKARTPPHAV
jgi:hypothetical protein